MFSAMAARLVRVCVTLPGLGCAPPNGGSGLLGASSLPAWRRGLGGRLPPLSAWQPFPGQGSFLIPTQAMRQVHDPHGSILTPARPMPGAVPQPGLVDRWLGRQLRQLSSGPCSPRDPWRGTVPTSLFAACSLPGGEANVWWDEEEKTLGNLPPESIFWEENTVSTKLK